MDLLSKGSRGKTRLNRGPFTLRLQPGLSTLPADPMFLGLRSLLSSPPPSLLWPNSALGWVSPLSAVSWGVGCGVLGAGTGGDRSGWGVGQAACQAVMDAGRAGAFLMLTQAGKQMVFQPEGNFQGVALPQLPRPLHTGPAGLSFLFKAGAAGLGKGTGRGRWRLGQVVCVLGPEKLWGPAWSLPESPPLLAFPALRSTPPLCPALTQPCHFRPELNWGLTWPSSKAASRVSFLSYRADHITPDSGIEFRFRIK